MKKTLPILLIASLLFFACSDDDPVYNPKDPDPTKITLIGDDLLSFDADGGTKTVQLDIEGPSNWTVYTANDWIKLGEPDYNKNSFEVRLATNTTGSPLVGTISIMSDGETQVTVKVEQDINDVSDFFEVSTLERMNLKGNVKSVDTHFGYYLIDFNYSVAFIELNSLEFDLDGYLTNYVWDDGRGVTTVNIEYDSQKRIKVMKCFYDLFYQDYEVHFEYGDHGNYIPTQAIMGEVLMTAQGYNIAHQVWMPPMIKDLAKIKVIDNGSEFHINLEPDYSVSGWIYYTGLVDWWSWGINETVDNICALQLRNGYTVKSQTIYMEGYVLNDYSVDQEKGMMKQFTSGYTMPIQGISGTWYTATYNTDRLNSISKADFGDAWAVFAYNEELDIEQYLIQSTYEEDFVMDIDYEYDDYGNWYKAFLVDSDGDRTTFERNISYN